MGRVLVALEIGFVFAAVTQAVIAENPRASRPNIVFIVSDDQRPDTICAVGNKAIETPNLDRLAARGTVFTRAYAGYPICHVSRAQILTGCCAFRALPQYPAGAIDSKLATIAGTLQKAGYHTVYAGKWHNDGQPTERGYTKTSGLYSAGGAKEIVLPDVDDRGRPLTGYRGWTFKDEHGTVEIEKGVGLRPNNSQHIGNGAVRALRSAPRDRPIFLHVNFAFPHDPRQWPVGLADRYTAEQIPLPPNFAPRHPFDHGNENGRDEQLVPKPLTAAAIRNELALYYAMITDVDAHVGRIAQTLEETGRGDNTLIVFTSDQGLALGSHGLLGKQNQYEHSIRSPLILAGAGLPRNERSTALVELADLFPTFCDLAGIAVPPTVEARSLLPLLRRELPRVHEFVTGVFTNTQRMICDERWKLIVYPQANREQFFDLRTDPDERHDLTSFPEHRPQRERLKYRLQQWQREHHDPLVRDR